MLKIIFQTEESPPELRQFDVLSLLKPADSVTWIEQEENCQYHLPFGAHLLVEQMHGPSRKQNNVMMWWVQLDAFWQIQLTLV